MSSKTDKIILFEYRRLKREGEFRGRKIVVIDPEEPQYVNIYEDLDQDRPRSERQAVVTLQPEYNKAQARGDDAAGQYVMSHAKVFSDIDRMLKQGFIIKSITRDNADRHHLEEEHGNAE